MLSGFSIVQEKAADVYFDDPKGSRPAMQLVLNVFSKIITGDMRCAAKLWRRRGSGLFFCASKADVAGEPATSTLMNV